MPACSTKRWISRWRFSGKRPATVTVTTTLPSGGLGSLFTGPRRTRSTMPASESRSTALRTSEAFDSNPCMNRTFPSLSGLCSTLIHTQSLASDRGLLFVIFVTLANATGDPPTHFIGPTNDRNTAATLLVDDLLLRTFGRINLDLTRLTRADLDGGLGKDGCAGQQPQWDQDGIPHHIVLQAPARWAIKAQPAGALRVHALFKAGV